MKFPNRTHPLGTTIAAILLVAALAATAFIAVTRRSGGEAANNVAGAQRPTLIIGIQDPATPELVKASGVFDSASFDLEWGVLTGAQAQLTALYSGAIDIGYVGDTGVLFEAANAASDWSNGPLLQNFVAWDYNWKSPFPSPITAVRAEAGIEGAEDLRGRKWSYSFGGAAYAQYVGSLTKANLTAADIEPIQLADAYTAGAAFERGEADVFSGPYVVVSRSIEAGKTKVLWTPTDTQVPNLACLTAKPSVLADKKAEIEEFLKRWGAYQEWLKDNPEKATEIFARVLKLEPEAARSWWENNRWSYIRIDDAVIAREQALADGFYAAGTLKKEVDVSALWNRDFEPVLDEVINSWSK
ncbi:ABC transporter substrate-binding protein [Celeribacter indicus]|uniref:ABC transporter substrate-binding protein n=1 Tax=Celeribacter indicus TaxID=1208324 RepID=A0A0B5DZC3_9RHOB|nr:ABC transporter substrate-binding protein [Celeribacter indicus]AJE48798.1 ABC transporter substrate-binding protein [Celeribacter indicus]SDW37702.1 sulfonate transport system substrate-binding protein [Celeribacter indicus]